MKKLTFLLLLLSLGVVLTHSQTVVYENDFETPGLSPGFNLFFNEKTNPKTGRYLGKFSGLTRQTAKLNLESLPSHKFVKVSFDVLTGMTWDGNGRGYIDLNDLSKWGPDAGPDIYKVTADGKTMVHTTFASNDIDFYRFQSYPGTYPQDTYRPGTGAVCTDCLGCNWDVDWYFKEDPRRKKLFDAKLIKDALYHFDIVYPHETTSTEIVWQTFNLTAAWYFEVDVDEWWGLDNVQVTVYDDPPGPLTVCEPELFQKIIPDKVNNKATIYLWGEANTDITVESTIDMDTWVSERFQSFNGYSKSIVSLKTTLVGPQSLDNEPLPNTGMKLFRVKQSPKVKK